MTWWTTSNPSKLKSVDPSSVIDRQTSSRWRREIFACPASSTWWIGYHKPHNRVCQWAQTLQGSMRASNDFDGGARSRLVGHLFGHPAAKEGGASAARKGRVGQSFNYETRSSRVSTAGHGSRLGQRCLALVVRHAYGSPWFRSGQRIIPRRSLSPIWLYTTTPAASVPLWKAIWHGPCSLLWHWRIFDHVPQRNPGLYSQFAWRSLRRRPKLSPLSGEAQLGKSANTSSEARLDVSARGFWGDRFAQTMFDVRIFPPKYSLCAHSSSQQPVCETREGKETALWTAGQGRRRRHICSAGLQHCRRNGSLFKCYFQAHCNPVGREDWTKLRRHNQCCALPAVVCIAAVCHYSIAWFTTPGANFHQFSASACLCRGKSATLTIDIFFLFLLLWSSQSQHMSLSGYMDCNVVTYQTHWGIVCYKSVLLQFTL